MHEAAWAAAAVSLVCSGSTQLLTGLILLRGRSDGMWTALRACIVRRPLAAAGAAGVIAEDVCYVAALRWLSAPAAQGLLGLYPVAFNLWLQSSSQGRWRLSWRALAGVILSCSGAGAVLISTHGSAAVAGSLWGALIGVVLIGLAVAGIAAKSQEYVLLVDIENWTGRQLRRTRAELGLSLVISGGRNVIASVPVLGIAAVLGFSGTGRAVTGALIAGLVLFPAVVFLQRFATLAHSNLGIGSVRSLSVLCTLLFAAAASQLHVNNPPLMVLGVCGVVTGTLMATTAGGNEDG